MDIGKIPPGENPPHDINVVIEIPGGAGGGSPVKYEICFGSMFRKEHNRSSH